MLNGITYDKLFEWGYRFDYIIEQIPTLMAWTGIVEQS
jgi:hypothetical protein